MANHYATLGLWLDASDDEIRQTYRRLVRLYHPDRNPGDPSAAARFREVQAAYEVLGSASARTWYDASLRPLEQPAEPQPERSSPPAVVGPADRPSARSLFALALGAVAIGLLLAAVVAQAFFALPVRTLLLLRVVSLLAGLSGAALARDELRRLRRLRELHEYGVRAEKLPQPSRATRTAARSAWMLARAAPLGFVLFVLADLARRYQELAPALHSLQGLGGGSLP